jgi:hypothetical protein
MAIRAAHLRLILKLTSKPRRGSYLDPEVSIFVKILCHLSRDRDL